jgi:hypothetical protein
LAWDLKPIIAGSKPQEDRAYKLHQNKESRVEVSVNVWVAMLYNTGVFSRPTTANNCDSPERVYILLVDVF